MHIRESERKMKDSFFRACINISGFGMSIPEAAGAVVVVANTMFGID